MRLLSLILMVALATSFAACTSQEKRSMDAMRGDCAAYEWDMRKEFVIADGETITTKVFSTADSEATPVSLKGTSINLFFRKAFTRNRDFESLQKRLTGFY